MAKKAAKQQGQSKRKPVPSRQDKSSASAPRPALPAATLLRSAGGAYALLVLLRVVAARFPEARLWGLSFPGYLPEWAELLTAALGLALASPLLFGLFQWKARLLQRGNAVLFSLLGAAAAAVLFWLLRMDTFFLGDGASYLAEHFRWVRGASISEDVLFSAGSAPLTARILATGATMFFDAAHPTTLTSQPQFIFQLLGVLSGAVFVFLVMLTALRRDEDASLRLARIALLIGTPATLFFFGYVEYYTMYFTALTAFFISSIAVAERRLSPVWMLAAFVLSSALHLMTLVTLPGLLLALASRGDEKLRTLVNTRVLLAGAAAALVAGGIYYFASGVATEGSRVILALAPFGEEGAIQHYTLLSGAHLGDVINMLLLSAAPALLLLPFLRNNEALDEPQVVALAHVIFTGFLLLFGYTCFGMARDWDVNAGFGVATALLAITLLARQKDPTRRSYLAYLASGAAVVTLLPWIAVNVDTTMSEQRFRDIMALDDQNVTGDFALNGYEHLRKQYQREGQLEEETWAMLKKVEMVGYPRDFRKLLRGITLNLPAKQQRSYMDAVFDELQGKLLRMKEEGTDSLYAGSRSEFVEVAVEALLQIPQLTGLRDVQDSYFEQHWQRFNALLPGDPLLRMVKDDYRYERGEELTDAVPFLEALPEIRSSSLIASRAGRALITTGHPREAQMILERAMEIDSSFTLPHFLLGYIAATAKPPRPAEAIAHLQRFIDTPEGHQLGNEAAQQKLIGQARQLIGNMTLLQFEGDSGTH
ncbi:hypothetical protein KQI65_03820 [bacterium]|nr:hypothetical protein [bacterium]